MQDRDLYESDDLTPEEAQAVAASEFRAALGWGAFGVAVLVASLRMDRLENQDINPYTIPGLLPALLGIVFIVLALLMGLRSWRNGGAARGAPRLHLDAAVARRVALVIALVVVYSIGLVGRGLPFWLASALFVTVSILVLQHPQRVASGQRLSWRDAAFAVAVGLGTGWIVTFVFQDLFLVRLP